MGEAGDKAFCGVGITGDGFFEQVRGHALVVARDQRLVAEHAGAVDGEPVQDAHGLAVACPGELEQGHGLVDIVRVSGPLGRGIGQVREQTAVDVGVGDLAAAYTDGAQREALVGALDGEDGAVDDGLVALLVEAQAGDLRQQVVEPGSGARVAVGACHGDVVLGVDGVVWPESLQAFEDAVADGRVARLRVQDHVDDALGGAAGAAHDEGARVEALAQAGSDLRRVRIAHEVELDDGPAGSAESCSGRSGPTR